MTIYGMKDEKSGFWWEGVIAVSMVIFAVIFVVIINSPLAQI